MFETNQQDYGIDAIGLHSLNRIVCLWYCASDDSHLRKPGFLPNSYILWELSVEHVNPGKEGWEEGKVEEEREWRSEPSRAGQENSRSCASQQTSRPLEHLTHLEAVGSRLPRGCSLRVGDLNEIISSDHGD